MKMSRSQMLSVINSMSDDKLAEALDATGVETGVQGYDMGEGEEAEGLESWNARDVSIESSPRPPIIDKAKFEKPQPQMGMRPKYDVGQDDLSGLQGFMPTEGMEGQY